MSIEITRFQSSDLASCINEVRPWLIENAIPKYFNSISDNTTDYGAFTMYPFEDTTAYFLPAFYYTSSSNYVTLRLKNGGSSTVRGPYCKVPRYGAKTDNGLFIYTTDGTSTIISKTNDNNTCIVHMSGVNTSNMTLLAVDFENSINLVNQFDYVGNVANFRKVMTKLCDKSLFVPYIFDGGGYTPNLLWSPYSQSSNFQIRKITINGDEYVYDGIFALRG